VSPVSIFGAVAGAGAGAVAVAGAGAGGGVTVLCAKAWRATPAISAETNTIITIDRVAIVTACPP
jgi:hypothetical protein